MSVSLDEVYVVELLLFSVLAFGIILLPPRWSLLCLLLAGCVEVVPPGFDASASVSLGNAIGRLLLPILLLLRFTGFRLPKIRWSFLSVIWCALTAYAAVATLWSPFKLSGLKMAAYLSSWFVLYLVFDIGWRRRWLDQELIMAALWGSLTLAFFQTVVLGNPLFNGNRAGDFASAQFSPFTGPQSFGPFLACLLTLLLFSDQKSVLRSLSIGACLLALIEVGSRYALIEAGVVTLIWSLLVAAGVRTKGRVQLKSVLALLVLAVIALISFRAVVAWIAPESRVNQLFEIADDPDVAVAGTFGWRLLIYDRVLTALSYRSPQELAFGSGTSSGGEIPQELDTDNADLDPNRNIHDEFLRAEYEWGLIGLGLGICMILATTGKLWVKALRLRSLNGFAALAIMPGILLALLIENPLAGPGTAESLGYLLVLSYGFALQQRVFAEREIRKPSAQLQPGPSTA
jgi:hypothetical protein